jgi:endo-1,4-beta-xylanase
VSRRGKTIEDDLEGGSPVVPQGARRSEARRRVHWSGWGLLVVCLAVIITLLVLFTTSRSHIGLKDVAATRGMVIGVAVHPTRFDDERYERTIIRDFDSVTPEVAMKFEVIHPCPPPALTEPGSEYYNASVAAWVASPGVECNGSARAEWNWGPMDWIVAWAEEHGLKVYGHTFLWHLQNPGWVTETELSPAELRWIMRDHITTIVLRYCTRDIYAYDVVNEGVAPDGTFLALGPWHRVPGYIDLAFRDAREALERCHPEPESVRLFYNDFDIEYGRSQSYDEYVGQPGIYDKSEAVYNFLEGLLAADDPTPVDGIGLQAHLWLGGEREYLHDTEEMVAVMERFAALGLEIKITEVDLPLYVDDPADYLDEQAIHIAGVAAACLEVPACTGLTAWGLRDAHSWRGGEWAPLLFSDEACGDVYCAKPAYYALLELFKE